MSEHAAPTPQVRRLERTHDRIVAGVCGGLGRYFDLNPAFFRLGFVVLTLLGGTGILVYLAALAVMPEEGKEQSLVEQVVAERHDRPWPLVGLAVAGVAALVLLSRATIWPAAGAGWVVLLAAGLIVLWASRGRHRSGIVVRALAGLALLAFVTAVAAIVVAFTWFNIDLGSGIGSRSYQPATAAAVAPSYHLGVGRLVVDLSQVRTTAPLHVKARVDVGQLRIVVPPDARVAVNARATVGQIDDGAQHVSGHDVGLAVGSGPLTLDARVGAGEVEVVRAP